MSRKWARKTEGPPSPAPAKVHLLPNDPIRPGAYRATGGFVLVPGGEGRKSTSVAETVKAIAVPGGGVGG